ncbi:MAG TPA: hypothetical protein VFP37_10960, partial [Steroidobacteraceae bacterium]|nr:hypothetical protein [Steroidobacteraceae bacterium]
PFLVLFVIDQAPERLGRLFPTYAAPAMTLMLLFLPAARRVARALGASMGEAYALSWNRRAAGLLVAGMLVATGRMKSWIPNGAACYRPALIWQSSGWFC